MTSIPDIRDLLEKGELEQAERQALHLSVATDVAEVRGEALLLAAQAGARQGDDTRAGQYIRQALEQFPPESEHAQKAIIYAGNIALHVESWDVAEQTFLDHLARFPGDGRMRPFALAGLAQVYEGRDEYRQAAEVYEQAAGAFVTSADPFRALAASNNRVWMLLLLGDLRGARVLIDEVKSLLEDHLDGAGEKAELLVHQLSAMSTYALYLENRKAEAVNFATELLLGCGPSNWSACLAAVVAARVFWEASDPEEAQRCLLLANQHAVAAYRETGMRSLAKLLQETAVQLERGA